MPGRKRVDEFIDAVVNGDHAKAIKDFYHIDASMQENTASPRIGRDKLIEHERAALARLNSMNTHSPETVLVGGDNVVIVWTFDATDKNGITRRLNEVTIQSWVSDRIAKERFVYDTAAAWLAVSKTES